jgi:hypothetical protein
MDATSTRSRPNTAMAAWSRSCPKRKIFDQLFEAIGDICDILCPQEFWNYLRAVGYASN